MNKDDRPILDYETPDWPPDEVEPQQPFTSARPDIHRSHERDDPTGGRWLVAAIALIALGVLGALIWSVL